MKKIFVLSLVALLLLSGCTTAKLSNGEDAIVTFKGEEGLTAENLYSSLKEKYGAEMLVDMIDTMLLEKEYDSTKEENTYINDTISQIESSAKQYQTDFVTYINYYYGIDNKEDFKDYLRLNYRRNLWVTDYAKTIVTDKQINTYYEEKSIGDIEARHILITADTTDDMSDDEKTAAEEKALKTAKEIIKKLDEGKKFEDLAKEYSDDTATAENGGYLKKFNRGEMDANFEQAAIELKVGTYSKTPVKSSYGYHIIFKISQDEKPTLEDAKEGIIETIASELLESDASIYVDGLVALREKYEMKFEDTDLEKGYNSSVNALYSRANSSNTSN